MTNGRAELSVEQERRLVECYGALRELADTCTVPAVRAAVTVALTELDVALEGQDIEVLVPAGS
jgi:uncharacterized protein DUF6052